MKLRDHPKLKNQWPPEPGGAYAGEVPAGGSDILEEVFYYKPAIGALADIALRTTWKGQTHTRDVLLHDIEFAEKLNEFLNRQVGRTVAAIGDADCGF